MADIGKETERRILIPIPDFVPEPETTPTPAPAPVEPEKVPA